MGKKMAWMVVEGNYSDYHVLCVCTTEAIAEQVVAEGEYYEAEIEKVFLYDESDEDEEVDLPLVEDLTSYHGQAILFDDGRVDDQWIRSDTSPEFDAEDKLIEMHLRGVKHPTVEYVRDPFLRDKAGYLRVDGLNEEGVAKVMTECIAQFKAGTWLPQYRARVE